MASPVVQTFTTLSKTGGTSFQLSVPTGVSDGDLLVVAVISSDTGAVTVSSTGWTNTWTWLGSRLQTGARIELFRNTWQTGDPTGAGNIVVTTPNTQSVGHVLRIDGHDGTTPIIGAVGSAGAATGGNPDPVAAGTHSAADILVLAFGGGDGKNNSFTAPANYTLVASTGTNNDGPAANASIGTIRRALTSSGPDDPGAFGGGFTSTSWVALTIDVQAPVSYDKSGTTSASHTSAATASGNSGNRSSTASASHVSAVTASGSAADAYAADTISNTDLLAYWRFGDSGTTAVDEEGSYDFTYGAGVTTGETSLLGTGVTSDTAITNDGTSEVGTAPSGLSPWSGSFTIECWARDDRVDPSAAYHGIASTGTYLTDGFRLGAMNQYWAFWTGENGGNIYLRDLSGGLGTVVSGEKRHIVLTYNGTDTFTLYVNGEQVAQDTSGTYVAATGSLQIGGGNSGIIWDGALDEFAVYDDAKSATWVEDRYILGAGPDRSGTVSVSHTSAANIAGSGSLYALNTLENTDLLGYWRLGDTGTDILDSSGNGYNTTFGTGVTKGVTSLLDSGVSNDKAVSNDATDGISAASVSSSLNPWAGSFTIEAWCTVDDTTGFRAIAGRGVYQTNGFRFGRRDGSNGLAFWTDENYDNLGGGFYISSGVAPATDGTAYHLVVTYDGVNSWKLYVDGSLVDSVTSTEYNAPSGGLDIGEAGGGIFWAGDLDELAVYDDEKSSTWVSDRHDLGTGNLSDDYSGTASVSHSSAATAVGTHASSDSVTDSFTSAATVAGQTGRSASATDTHSSAAVASGQSSRSDAITDSYASATSSSGSRESQGSTTASSAHAASVAGETGRSGSTSASNASATSESGSIGIIGTVSESATSAVSVVGTGSRSGTTSDSASASITVAGIRDNTSSVQTSNTSSAIATGDSGRSQDTSDAYTSDVTLETTSARSGVASESASSAASASGNALEFASGSASTSHASSVSTAGTRTGSGVATDASSSDVATTASVGFEGSTSDSSASTSTASGSTGRQDIAVASSASASTAVGSVDNTGTATESNTSAVTASGVSGRADVTTEANASSATTSGATSRESLATAAVSSSVTASGQTGRTGTTATSATLGYIVFGNAAEQGSGNSSTLHHSSVVVSGTSAREGQASESNLSGTSAAGSVDNSGSTDASASSDVSVASYSTMMDTATVGHVIGLSISTGGGHAGTASVSGASAAVASGNASEEQAGSASMNNASSVVATGQRTSIASISESSVSDASVSGIREQAADIVVDHVSSVASVGQSVSGSQAFVSHVSETTVVGYKANVTAPASENIASGTSVAGERSHDSQVSVSASSSVLASGAQSGISGTASVSATSSITISGVKAESRTGAASVSNISATSTAGKKVVSGDASETRVIGVIIATTPSKSGSTSVTHVANIVTQSGANATGTASNSATSSVTASGFRSTSDSTTLTYNINVVNSGTKGATSTISIPVTYDVSLSTLHTASSTLSLDYGVSIVLDGGNSSVDAAGGYAVVVSAMPYATAVSASPYAETSGGLYPYYAEVQE